jgi:tRNA1(Val) A37 N6-methylase TrmN6
MQLSSFNRITNNLVKMGHFPTTREDAKYIGSHILTHNHFTIIDPCCGNGEALFTIATEIGWEGWDGSTLGIEIEEKRAEKAKENLSATISEDFFNLQIEKNSFSAVFLNPPYFKNEGLHQPFVEKSTNILAPNGLLILIIPEYELSGKTADYIASHYEKINIYKTNDKSFQQIILFGTKKEKPEITDGSQLHYTAKQAKAITYNKKKYSSNPSVYKLPRAKELKDIKILSRDINPEYLESILNNFNDDWNKITNLIPESMSTKKPLLPLRRGHLAQILASGLIDGVIEHPETKEKFLIKGTTTRTEEIIEDNEEETTTVTRDVITILMMDQKGNIQQIK